MRIAPKRCSAPTPNAQVFGSPARPARVPFAIEVALRHKGIAVDVRRVFVGDAIPGSVAGLDGLVVMGGPMSAASDNGFATHAAEVALLADAIRAQLPTLGVSRAQLLALAAGAAVYPGGPEPEIEWLPVSLLEGSRDDRLFAGLDQTLTVLHWHGDTFDIPPGGQHLARSARYANQAFRIGDTAWGVQFHLEVDVDAVEGFVTAFSADLANRPDASAAIRERAVGGDRGIGPHARLGVLTFRRLGFGARHPD